MNDSERNGLQEIIDKAIEEMAREAGDSFDIDHINLAEFSRRTGLSRSRTRSLKAKGFVVTPHGRCGMKAESMVISGFEGVVNALLMEGVTNSEVVFERIEDQGVQGRQDHGEELHRGARRPGARKAQAGEGRPAGGPRQALRDRAGRELPDGLGVREGRGLGWRRVQDSVLRHGVPPLRHLLRRVLPERAPGEPLHRHGPRLHGDGRAGVRAHRQRPPIARKRLCQVCTKKDLTPYMGREKRMPGPAFAQLIGVFP